jgi:hypothetical protein
MAMLTAPKGRRCADIVCATEGGRSAAAHAPAGATQNTASAARCKICNIRILARLTFVIAV